MRKWEEQEARMVKQLKELELLATENFKKMVAMEDEGAGVRVERVARPVTVGDTQEARPVAMELELLTNETFEKTVAMEDEGVECGRSRVAKLVTMGDAREARLVTIEAKFIAAADGRPSTIAVEAKSTAAADGRPSRKG